MIWGYHYFWKHLFKETPISPFLLNNLIACREISTAAPPRGRGQGLIRLLPRRVRRARRGCRRWSEGILGVSAFFLCVSTRSIWRSFFWVGSWASKTDFFFFVSLINLAHKRKNWLLILQFRRFFSRHKKGGFEMIRPFFWLEEILFYTWCVCNTRKKQLCLFAGDLFLGPW